MHRTTFGLTLTVLAIGLGGCGLFGGDDSSSIVEEIPKTAEAKTIPSPKVTPSPAVAPKAALTRPTDPDERLRVIKSGRPDPFADVLPSKPRKSNIARLPKPSVTKSLPAKAGSSTTKVVLPPLPQPDLAKAVKVTGIVTLGGKPQAIIQAPGEKVSRSVSVGDRIANGQVLIKAIDLSNRVEPVLILEEAGAQISVGIGREPVVIASAAPRIPQTTVKN